MTQWAAVSVDLDEIPHYAAIHGLDLAELNCRAVYEVAVPRLLEWAERVRIPLTLFAVGEDLEPQNNQHQLGRCVAEGHEIGNHSFSHLYDLTRRPVEELRREVERASDVIELALGQRPVGFRAPGYTTTDALYGILQELGFSYSSSVFPCPGYYGAKALAIGLKRLWQRRSQSIVDSPLVLTAPTTPYRVGRPYYRHGSGMLELPIQVTPLLRLPVIGTSLTLFGQRGARALVSQVVSQPFVNLELHGIDVLDRRDGLEQLAPHQYDVRVLTERKLAALTETVEGLRGRGFKFCTLRDYAQQNRHE